jgi:hypothetical protein
MAFLGINKELNFQTAMLHLGSVIAKSEGWYQYRRIFELVFVIGLGLTIAIIALKVVRLYRNVIERHLELALGVSLVLFYCLFRAAEIEHVRAIPAHDRIAHSPFWIVEMAGVVLVLIGALRAAFVSNSDEGLRLRRHQSS